MHISSARCLAQLVERAGSSRVQCPTCRQTCHMFVPVYAMRAHAAQCKENSRDDDASDDSLDDDERQAQIRAADEQLRQYSAQTDSPVGNLMLGWRTMMSFDNIAAVQRAAGRVGVGCVLLRPSLLTTHPLVVVIAIFLQLGYVIFPFDLLPEAVFGIVGFVDDFFFVLLVFVALGLFIRSSGRDVCCNA